MSRGDGDTSYASNSRLQKSILKTRPVLHKAVAAARAAASLSLSSAAGGAMVVTDLGCSSGPNTLLFVSEVLGAVADRREELAAVDDGQQQHVQFWLNDSPGTTSTSSSKSLEMFKKLAVKE